MARLFQCSVDNISLHLKNIYEEGELIQEATTEEFSVVRKEGSRSVRHKLMFYKVPSYVQWDTRDSKYSLGSRNPVSPPLKSSSRGSF